MWRYLLNAYRKRKYRNGRRLRGTIGYDAAVEIEIADCSRLDEGILLIRHRSIDTLVRDDPPGEFSAPVAVPVSKLWAWETYIPDEHEIVHTVTDFYDGTRGGIADFHGRPHAYRSLWDESEEDWGDGILLKPIDEETFRLAMEDWQIWTRWRRAFDRGQTTIETHPALQADRERHDYIAEVLKPLLQIEPEHAIRVRARFRVRGGQWVVQWRSDENAGTSGAEH